MNDSQALFIHGSWHWGGCFQKVTDRLAAQGIACANPDLASHGYDGRRWDAVADIEEYAAPAEALLLQMPQACTVVAHSMGGVTATYLAQKHPRRIRKLIYLCAFMTPAGKCALDYILGHAADPAVAALFDAVSQVDGGRGLALDLDKRASVTAAFYADCSPHDIEIARRNVLPVTTTVPDLAKIAISADRFFSLPRTYIECTADQAIPLSTQRMMQADVPGAARRTLDSSHSPFFSQPDALAALLIEEIRG